MSADKLWDVCDDAFETICDTLKQMVDANGKIDFLQTRKYIKTLFYVMALNPDIASEVITANAVSPDEILTAARNAEVASKERGSKIASISQTPTTTNTNDNEAFDIDAVRFQGNRGNSRGNFRVNSRFPAGRGRGNGRPTGRNNMPNAICSWCNRANHTEEQCFQKKKAKQTAQQPGRGGGRGYFQPST
ncbi:Hypothetical predicted protein, partial [Paramuricea clavata]